MHTQHAHIPSVRTMCLISAATLWLCVLLTVFEMFYTAAMQAARNIYFFTPITIIAVPFLFMLSVWAVRRYAPIVDGAGFFDVEDAAFNRHDPRGDLLSLRALCGRFFFTPLSTLSGASCGPFSPALHIAGAFFYRFSKSTRIDTPVLLCTAMMVVCTYFFHAPIAAAALTLAWCTQQKQRYSAWLLQACAFLVTLFWIKLFDQWSWSVSIGLPVQAVDLELLVLICVAAASIGLLFRGAICSCVQLAQKFPYYTAFCCGTITATILFIIASFLPEYHNPLLLSTVGNGIELLNAAYNDEMGCITDCAPPDWFVPAKWLANTAAAVSGISAGMIMPSIAFSGLLAHIIGAPVSFAASAYLAVVLRRPLFAGLLFGEYFGIDMVWSLVSAYCAYWIGCGLHRCWTVIRR